MYVQIHLSPLTPVLRFFLTIQKNGSGAIFPFASRQIFTGHLLSTRFANGTLSFTAFLSHYSISPMEKLYEKNGELPWKDDRCRHDVRTGRPNYKKTSPGDKIKRDKELSNG